MNIIKKLFNVKKDNMIVDQGEMQVERLDMVDRMDMQVDRLGMVDRIDMQVERIGCCQRIGGRKKH